VCSLDKQSKRNEELKRADVVVLTYACNDTASFSRLSSYWFPELKKLEVGDFMHFSTRNEVRVVNNSDDLFIVFDFFG